MLNPNGNLTIKIFRSIFAAVNLALIFGGLVSCGVQAPQPPAPTEQQKPVLQPNQEQQNDKDDDDKDGDDKDGDRKDGDDKDDND
ncbi:hypothetical protein LC605_01860 [Nostoc sp. CHAB 5836]|uniref:hypothetical protein n=1 Tax=Nostoc sp. CHAB 5836 TaxID=2780404 RepID=UPI001E390584|nr:hypothetical protein [Nostoc sp. CHAB 5836]MCC5613843.1 hypothetical protein [Nostoc sp. CHAB 5836]